TAPHISPAVSSSWFRVEPETQNLTPTCLNIRSEPDGAAALTGVRSANEGTGFRLNHDGVGAAEGFRIAGDNLVTSALQFLHCRFRNARFQANLCTFKMIEPRGSDRLLDCHAEVDEVRDDLDLNLGLDMSAFEAQGSERLATLHDQPRHQRVYAALVRTD